MLPGRLALVPPGSFVELATLLDSSPPGLPPISLAVGDPQSTPPPFIAEILGRHANEFGTYPPISGTPEWREAAAGGLVSRFELPLTAIDSERHLLPLNGTREGLFLALFTLVPATNAGARPVWLLPYPLYSF